MFYVAIYIIAAVVAYRCRSSFRSANNVYPFFAIIFFVLVAFRFEVGCDWTGYLNQYKYARIPSLDELVAVRDPLWRIIIGGFRHFEIPYPWVNVLMAAIFFVGVHALAKRQPNPLTFMVLLWPILIIHIVMSGIRQAAAIGILCLAYIAFVNKRTVSYVGFVLLASTLHSSALVFLLLTPLVYGEYSRTRLVIAAALAVPGVLLLGETDSVQLAVSRYVQTGNDAAGAAARVGLVAISGLIFFWLLRKPWARSRAADYKLVSVGSFMMVGLAFLVPWSTVIADRLAYFLIPLQTVILTRIPFLRLNRYQAIYAAIPYIVLGLTLVVWTLTSRHFNQCYVPYQTWLFGTPSGRLEYMY